MKRIIYTTVAVLSFYSSAAKAGNSATMLAPKDTTPHLGSGFTLTAIAGLSWAFCGKEYLLEDNNSYVSYKYDLKSAPGFRLGLGIGVQGKKYGFEIPLIYSADRYKVPAISDDVMRFSSFEFGFNNYIKPGGGNHYILIGPYAALDFYRAAIHEVGLGIGYGYSITKRLNLSLRYKANIFGLFDDYAIKVSADSESNINYRYGGNTSGLQLVARFDIVNTRKIKKYVPPPPPPRIPQNYTSYSDVELIKLMQEAKAKNDIATFGDIQREADLRKSRNPYGKYDDAQLVEMLGKAVKSEDFLEAERIQKEQKRREAIKAAEAQ